VLFRSYLFIRGHTNSAGEGAAFIRTVKPDSVTLDIIPGIFEGYTDFSKWNPNEENPFERLIDPACLLVFQGILQDAALETVFVIRNKSAADGELDSVDTEFNLRLGTALLLWAEKNKQSGWIELGRSLILSVIARRDSNGSVPQTLVFANNGSFEEAPGGRIGAARLYRILEQGEYSPHAVEISSAASNVWAWTAAAVHGSLQENNIFDISVSFPAGETHYMIIWGIPPFDNIQLYNTNWPTDTQFERYDSSGWVYYSQEKILVLKMRHRVTEEHIRIYFEEPE
jgi:hypothetical protein